MSEYIKTRHGHKYAAEKASKSEPHDHENYAYATDPKTGQLYKIPYTGKEGMAAPAKVPKGCKYWRQEYECYQDETGKVWKRPIGERKGGVPSDLPGEQFHLMVEDRRRYMKYVDTLHTQKQKPRGSSASSKKAAGPKPKHMRLGVIPPGSGPKGSGYMAVYGHVGSDGSVYDMFLRPMKVCRHGHVKHCRSHHEHCSQYGDKRKAKKLSAIPEDDEAADGDIKVNSNEHAESVLAALKKSVMAEGAAAELPAGDDAKEQSARDFDRDVKHLLESIRDNPLKESNHESSDSEDEDTGSRPKSHDPYRNDADRQSFHQKFMVAIDNDKLKDKDYSSDEESGVKAKTAGSGDKRESRESSGRSYKSQGSPEGEKKEDTHAKTPSARSAVPDPESQKEPKTGSTKVERPASGREKSQRSGETSSIGNGIERKDSPVLARMTKSEDGGADKRFVPSHKENLANRHETDGIILKKDFAKPSSRHVQSLPERRPEKETKRSTRSSQKGVTSTVGLSEACKVCFARKVDTVILECGHLCVCEQCGVDRLFCPLCEQPVTKVLKVSKK